MATVSDKPWGSFSQADYTPAQWKRACLIDTGTGDPASKDRYKLPVREPDGTLNRNGVHAAAGGHGVAAVQGISSAQRAAAAKTLMGLYGDLGEKPPPSLMSAVGTLDKMPDGKMSRADGGLAWPMMMTRAFSLDDAAVRTGRQTCESCGQDATGRMVDAYAGVFNEPAEIQDDHGHYIEEIDPTAWNKRLADLQRATAGVRAVGVFYHHGQTLYGTPSESGSVPVGHPSIIRTDNRGLITSTHYARDPFAQRILDGIIDGNIGGQSFTGRIVRSNPDRIPRARRGDQLPTVRRLELGLVEYGPTPMPYYAGATTVAVRSQIPDQHPDEAADTAPPPPSEAGTEEPQHALRSAEETRRKARRALVLKGMRDGAHPARTDR